MKPKQPDLLQQIVDGIAAMSCVVSVEKRPDGKCGTVRVVTGNPAYIASIEHPQPGMEMLTSEFIPNSEYTRYLTRDLNFEDYCYRAAVEKKCLHSYAHPDRIDAWFDMTFMPLAIEEDDLCFCIYTMEIDFRPNAQRLSNIDGDLASAVLETSIKLNGAGDFGAAIKEVIHDIRLLCGAEFSCILLMDEKTRMSSVLCLDIAEDSGLQEVEPMNSEEFYALAVTCKDTIAGSNCLLIKDERDREVVRERNPRWYASLIASKIERLVLFPLKNQDQLLGYIWATNFAPENATKIKETLELATFVLSSEIANDLLLRQLRHMSTTDMLTGLQNRNALNRRIEEINAAPEPMSVIFADLNGLKDVNDSDGHDAGDALLRDAACALRLVFGSCEVFRAGGDEFVVFLSGAAEEELAQKTQALRQAAARYEKVDFAVGWCAETEGCSIEQALNCADERMYEDKRRYYELHPEKKRGI